MSNTRTTRCGRRTSRRASRAISHHLLGERQEDGLELGVGLTFDPRAFAEHLDAQPDLGTKWRPGFVRIVEQVPTAGNNKTTKTGLRREAWLTPDPVYWRPGPRSGCRRLLMAEQEALAGEFARHGRTALLPAATASTSGREPRPAASRPASCSIQRPPAAN